MADLGLAFKLEVESDSSSARAFASRRGLGRQRHVQTRYLWMQDQVATGMLLIKKVASGDNVADVLTKVVAASVLARHMEKLGLRDFVRGSGHKRA